MIKTFRCRDTEELFETGRSRRFQAIIRTAMRKLILLDEASTLHDLKLPGNKLEALKDDRRGQHSIRVNDQYRVCFRWVDGHACDVAIEDYH